MTIRETLKRAGEEGRASGQHEIEALRSKVEDIESTLRRRMRLHPQAGKNISSHPENDPAVAQMDPRMAAAIAQTQQPEAPVQQKPIISINGRDLTEEEQKRKVA